MRSGGYVICRLSRILGHGVPPYQIASSAIVAMISFFYIYTVASHLQLRIYPLVDRVTYYINFQAYVISEYADHVILGGLLLSWLAITIKRSGATHIGVLMLGAILIVSLIMMIDTALDAIALASLPIIIALALCKTYLQKKILKYLNLGLVIEYVCIIGVIAGTISLVYGIMGVVSGNPPQATVRSYAYDIFLIFSSFSPVLMLSLIMCFPVKILINFVYRYLKGRKTNTTQVPLSLEDEKELGVIKKIVLLSLIMLLSIVVAIIPHLSTINKDNQQVSVDTGYYVTWINALKDSDDFPDFLYQAFVNQNGGDRPLSLIFLYGLDQVTNSNLFFTIEYVAVILGPALVLTIYFLTREITSNDITSLIAAFITAVSFHMLIGIYAGFYANWLALILGYLSFLFFIRFLKKGGSENLLLYGILATAMLFTHVYTWSVLSIVAGLFLLIMILRPRSLSNTGRRNAILLMLVLLLTVVMDVSRATATGASGGVERDLEWANVFIDPENYLLRWNNLSYTTTTFVGGIFANFIIFGLCLYWLGTTKMQSTGAIFLMIFFSIGILPFLIGEWVIQTRVFYNVPFQIPAAIAVTYIMQRPSKKLLKLIMLFIWLVAIATVSVSNFYLVTPRAAT